jgi:hypothetical protein
MSSWYTPSVFEPIKYIPASKKAEIRAKLVYALHAIAHSQIPGPYSGDRTNHWCVYLHTSEGEGDETFCINAIPNPQQAGTTIPGGSKADVIVSLFHGPIEDVTHKVTMAVTEGLTVGHIIDLLAQHGREMYEFTPPIPGELGEGNQSQHVTFLSI